MDSTRLPGKALADIEGQPLLAHVIGRTKAARTVDSVVVATTTEPVDKAIELLALREGVAAYRGQVDDVLHRFYQAAGQISADLIVRITGDDPFKDPDVIDRIILHALDHPEVDYASNTLEATFPEGLDTEVFSFRALETAWREARLPSEREHVTPYLWKNPGRFRMASIRHSEDLSHLRWTIDYTEDLDFARAVYSRLSPSRIFRMDDILALLAQEPNLLQLCPRVVRNFGYQQSLRKDQQVCP